MHSDSIINIYWGHGAIGESRKLLPCLAGRRADLPAGWQGLSASPAPTFRLQVGSRGADCNVGSAADSDGKSLCGETIAPLLFFLLCFKHNKRSHGVGITHFHDAHALGGA